MDREGAKLIQILYKPSEDFPKMVPIAALSLIASLMVFIFLMKMWFPKKKRKPISDMSIEKEVADSPPSPEMEEKRLENEALAA